MSIGARIAQAEARRGIFGEMGQIGGICGFGLTALGESAIAWLMSTAAPIVQVENQIHLIRGQRVMLDSDLAALYQVETKNLNKAVNRNQDRFPTDFAFVLTQQEVADLRFQSGTSKIGRGGRRYLPYAFTQEGVAMLASVLRSKRAIQMNIAIVRAFVRLRELIAAHKELAEEIEKLKTGHAQHASIINLLVEEIESIKALPEPSKKRIGFHADEAETELKG
jgi:phage regulator Rha-like protein